MRKIEDLWRARQRSALEPLQPPQDISSVKRSLDSHPPLFETSESTNDFEVAQAAIGFVAKGQVKMNRDIMRHLLDISSTPLGPFNVDDYDILEHYWDRWMGFAEPEWIDSLLELLEEEAIHPTPQELDTGFDFGVSWNTFQLLFWDVAEHFPQAALAKLQPYLSHADVSKRKIAQELVRGIEEDL
jgi:hypothetical protein